MTSPRSSKKAASSRRFSIRTVLLLLAVLAAAFALRFFFVRSLAEELPWPDAREYHVLGLELQNSWEYINSAGSPVVYWPPGYPYFLGLVYRAFGPSIYAARVVQSVLGALTCLLCYLIAARLFDRRCAALAAVFAAIYPLTIYTAATLYPAVLQTFLLACVIYLCLWAKGRIQEASAAGAGIFRFAPLLLSAGVVAACSALVSPASLPALGLAAVWLAWPVRGRGAGREGGFGSAAVGARPGAGAAGGGSAGGGAGARVVRGVTFALLFLTPVIVALGAWSIRNHRAFGRPVAVSANGGFNFWLGNHPDVTATTGNRMTPAMREELGSVYAKYRNIAVRDSVLYDMGLRYASSDPGRFVRLSAAKALNFWRLYPQPMTGVQPVAGKEKLLSLLSYGLLLPFGLVWLFRSLRRSSGAWLILLVFIAYTAVHAVFISKVRFRLPIDPYIMIYASGALIALLDFLGGRIRSRRAPHSG